MHQPFFFFHSRNIKVIWWWLRSKRCISWYFERIWQCTAPRSSIKTRAKLYRLQIFSYFDKSFRQQNHIKQSHTQSLAKQTESFRGYTSVSYRAILNNQYSSRNKVEAEVHQGLTLEPPIVFNLCQQFI